MRTGSQRGNLILTVDVEPDWGKKGTRSVREVLPRLVELLKEEGATATFFVVADLLKECGKEIALIAPPHELASHGLTHRPFDSMSVREIRYELKVSRERLQELGRPVRGVRAPFFRRPSHWLDYVAEAGYKYDSSAGSVYPSVANTPPHRWRVLQYGGVRELPISTFRDRLTPFALTYMRILYPFSARMMAGREQILYLHLHELLPSSAARDLPFPLRLGLTRNCGEMAWRILAELLAKRQGECISCEKYLDMSNGWNKGNERTSRQRE